MSLSEIQQRAEDELTAKVDALHEEICYMRGQWPKLETMVQDLHRTMTSLQPLVDKYATVTGGAAARWTARRRGISPGSSYLAHSMACLGVQHEPDQHCQRRGPHAWMDGVGCHVDAGECNG